MRDPVAWSGKRGWDVILFRFRSRTLRSPRKSNRELHVDTIRDAAGDRTAAEATSVPTSPPRDADASGGASGRVGPSERQARWEEQERAAASASRDIADVPAVEIITTAAVHLMSAAAVKLGLAAEDNAAELKDLDEARKLITALAGLVTAAAPEIGSQHAGPLRDGLRSLQLAFREESLIPDAPGKGPGEKYTGAVN